MCRRLSCLALVLGFCLMSSAHAATIIWVSDNKAFSSVVAGGAADQGWVDLLRTHGYTVDYRGENGSTNVEYWRNMDNAKV